MIDARFPEQVPDWPPLAGAGALVGGSLMAVPAALLAALLATIAGLGSTPPAVLLFALLSGAGTLALVAWIAGRTAPLRAPQLGLRAPSDLARAAGLTVLAAVVVAAMVALLSLAADVGGTLAVPPELDPRGPLARSYDLALIAPVEIGPDFVASALARCVIPAIVGEVLLRGFAFPALARWRGVVPAGLVVAVLFGGLANVAGGASLAVPSIVLGVMLCVLYLMTASLLPGIALTSAAAGAALGASTGLGTGSAALVACVCALTAVACVAPLTRLAGPRARRAVIGRA